MFHTVAQLRQIEQLALARQLPLMQRAGAAAADCIAAQGAGPVLLLVGPGNNGGDALVAARLLQSRGIAVAVLMPGDTDQLPADAAAAYRDWLAVGGTIHKVWPAGPWTMLVDGLFGIGLNRPLQPYWQAIIDQANAQALPTLALDVPSGIHADTGAALGRPIRADWTLSFIGTARGLLTGAACNVVGQRLLARLDVPEELLANGELASCATISAEMQLDRPSDSHKGRFGTLAIIGGAAGMVGAALLAGRAALHAGAGKVYAGLLDPQGPSVDFARPELMLRPATAELMDQASTIAIGPGLGVSAEARRLLRHALASSQPLLLDADALNLIAEDAALRQTLAIRPAVTILTPHPSEAARLLACSTAAIQADRYGAARQLASLFAATIVLKGAGSVVADGEQMAVNTGGSAALANAGQGDVLSGLIAALLAQGMAGWPAAKLGVHLHSAASDALLAQDGRLVTLAGDVAEAAGRILGAQQRAQLWHASPLHENL